MHRRLIGLFVVAVLAALVSASPVRATCGPDGSPCDDGNPCTAGDVCTSSVCGGFVVADGTSCSDGNACTAPDTCVAGTCTGGAPVVCTPCLQCDTALGCVAAPRLDCRLADKPEKGALQFTDGIPPSKDIVKWKWPAGSATTLADLGNPTATSDVTLCVYDQSTPTTQLVFRATAPAGGLCGSRPCWRGRASGFDYNNGAATGDGLVSMKLKSGNAGKAKMLLKGKGGALSNRPFGIPAPPMALPLRTQLQIESGVCFEAIFETGGVIKNEPGFFKGRASP
ncbi:MAG: hypothetical protein KIT14_05850 [bacterium]|nr:hypothetical protein [bacterium]